MKNFSLNALVELETLRGSTALVYCTNDCLPKRLTAADLLAFSRVLHGDIRSEELDFILHSHGGEVSAARALALQLRECTNHLNILVPCKARSSATLLCLAADEIVLTRSAEFSPIDPMIASGTEASSPLPKRISSEDIRSYRAMAEEWFDLHSEESRMQVLALLTQRISPTTLAAFFRADRYVRKVAQELIEYQLPDREPAQRTEIAQQLISGHGSHQDVICYQDILKLGLRTRLASELEAKLMSQIIAECQDHMNADDGDGVKSSCRAMFLGRGSGIKFVVQRSVRPDAPGSGSQRRARFAHQGRRVAGKWVDIRPPS